MLSTLIESRNAWFDSGSLTCFKSITLTRTVVVAPRKLASATTEPNLASSSRGFARLGAHKGTRIRNRAVLEPNLRLKSKLEFLVFRQDFTVWAHERQVRRQIIALFCGSFEFGYDLAVPLEETV